MLTNIHEILYDIVFFLQEADLRLKDGEDLLKSKRIKDAANQFLWVLKRLEQVLVLPVKEYCICQQHLHTCYLMEGNMEEDCKKKGIVRFS